MLDGGELLLLWVFSVSLHDRVDMHSRIYQESSRLQAEEYFNTTKYIMHKSLNVFCREDISVILREQMIRSRFGIKSLALFGSVARNEATQESDIDFIVDFEGVVTFDRYMDLKIFLEDLFGKKIDLAIEESLKPQIRQKIVEEAIYVT
jgi:uncharacterized protein